MQIDELAQPLIWEARISTSPARSVQGSKRCDRCAEPVLHEFRGCGQGIKFGSHGSSPSVGSDTMTIQIRWCDIHAEFYAKEISAG